MLCLVSFSADHFDTLASWFSSQRDVVQWGGPNVHYPLDERQLQAMVDDSLSQPPVRLCWMAKRGADFVGHAQLGLDWRNGNALLARVVVSPECRGQRLGGEMLQLVLDQALAIDEMQRVELNVYTWNTPAIKTYQRLGFLTEGVRRSSVRVEEERWDTTIMALLRSELNEGSPGARRRG